MTTKVIDLVKRFGRFEALKKVNLEVEDGEFVAILGPSGCGKTTLLRLLAGFDSPSDGSLSINEKEVSNTYTTLPPEKRNIGMVFQSFALWPHLSVEEHIKFPLMHHPFVPTALRKSWEKRVDKVLQMVELTEWKDRMPNELSGGQKQRVALARAIAPKPELLLMDEPLSNLDAELRMEMRKEIQDIHRLTKATIIYVTHDQSEALAMADRIVVMNQGKIEQVGTPKEVFSKPKTEFVASFVGKANLVKGKWRKGYFSPILSPESMWPDLGVSEDLKKRDIYPLRPEQLEITFQQDGLPGIITSVQYQGKEMHYTIQTEDQTWTVHTDTFETFHLGDPVCIRIKEDKKAPIDSSNLKEVVFQ